MTGKHEIGFGVAAGRRWRPPGWAVVVAALVVLYGPWLLDHVRVAADPLTYNGDARIFVAPLQIYDDEALFRDDAVAAYVRSGLPIGYHLLYRAASRFVDVRTFSKQLPIILMAITLLAVGLAANRLAGAGAAFGAVALALGLEGLVDRSVGGLPRSFAPALAAATAWALVAGRPRWLAGITCVAACFYPVLAVLSGTCLVLLSWLPVESAQRGAGPARLRVAARVGLTGLVCLLLVAPLLGAARRYGPTLGPNDLEAYPEAGPEGRYLPGDHLPYRGLPADLRQELGQVIRASGPAFVPALREPAQAARRPLALAILAGVALGLARSAARDVATRRLLLLAVAAVAAHTAALLAAPYLFIPIRYLRYAVPVLFVLGVPTACAALVRGSPRAQSFAAVGGCLVILLLLGGRGAASRGYDRTLPARPPVIDFVASLPPSVQVAGWPAGLMDDLPYLARRSALVTFETHQAFHAGYVLEMRRRVEALIDAYYATEPAPLERLRDEFGVTHLVADARHRDAPPAYFEPFRARLDHRVRESRAGAGAGSWELERQREHAAVFEAPPHFVLDLSRLRGTDGGASSRGDAAEGAADEEGAWPAP